MKRIPRAYVAVAMEELRANWIVASQSVSLRCAVCGGVKLAQGCVSPWRGLLASTRRWIERELTIKLPRNVNAIHDKCLTQWSDGRRNRLAEARFLLTLRKDWLNLDAKDQARREVSERVL